jgi:hypothetical protein
MAKKAKKSSSGTKRAIAKFDFTKKAAVVLGECALAVGRGMEREMQKDPKRRPHVLNDDARDYWVKYHLKSIPKAFANYGTGANWPKQRAAVTLMAELLGAAAAQFATADVLNQNSTVIQVTLDHVKDASATVRGDKRCVGAKKAGQGIYCES